MNGVRDVMKAFALFSGVYAIAEIAGKRKTREEAKAWHDDNMARLDRIERGLEAVKSRLK